MTRSEPQFFELCGLLIRTDEPLSDLPLPAVAPSEADIRIEWREDVPARPDDAAIVFTTTIGASRLSVYHVEHGTLWEYPDATRIWVSGNTDEIRCAFPPDFVIADVATYLLGPILGYVLRQRGIPTLHASSVLIGDRTVAFAGPAGAGKSTLTAALVARGHRLVAEDVSAVRHDGTGFSVLSGVPFIKLWPDSAAAHGALPLLTPNWEKHYLAAPAVQGPSHLDAVFFLSAGEAPAVAPLSQREALVALLDNIYVAYSLSLAERSSDLQTFGAMAESTAMYRLTRTDDLDAIAVLCDLVEACAR